MLEPVVELVLRLVELVAVLEPVLRLVLALELVLVPELGQVLVLELVLERCLAAGGRWQGQRQSWAVSMEVNNLLQRKVQ